MKKIFILISRIFLFYRISQTERSKRGGLTQRFKTKKKLKQIAKSSKDYQTSGKFLSTLHKVLQCPLFSDLTGQIWMELRKSVFDSVEDDSLSQIIMASTMTIIQDQGSKNKSLMESVIFKIEFILTEKNIFFFFPFFCLFRFWVKFMMPPLEIRILLVHSQHPLFTCPLR